MKVITESEMSFGKFDENSIVFLEAKKSCSNAANRYESEEKEQKFEEYYSSITEKFIASL